MGLVFLFIALLVVIISLDCSRSNHNKPRFYSFLAVIFGFIMIASGSKNLLVILFSMELATVASAGFIGYKKIRSLGKPASGILVLNLASFVMMLSGALLVFLNSKTLQLDVLVPGVLSLPAAFLILFGILLSWMQVPLLVKISELAETDCYVGYFSCWASVIFGWQFVLLKVFGLAYFTGQLFVNIVILFLLVWIFIWSAAALAVNTPRRILPCILFGQAGYTMLAIFSGEVKFALLYIFAQLLALTGIYFSAGLTGDKSNRQLLPLAKTGFLLCAFSAIGLPPLFGFWPKFMTVMASMNKGHIFVEVGAVAMVVFALFYFIRLYNKIFDSDLTSDNKCSSGNFRPWVIFGLGLLSLVLGLVIRSVYYLLLFPIR